jgi:hypothetical protein
VLVSHHSNRFSLMLHSTHSPRKSTLQSHSLLSNLKATSRNEISPVERAIPAINWSGSLCRAGI